MSFHGRSLVRAAVPASIVLFAALGCGSGSAALDAGSSDAGHDAGTHDAGVIDAGSDAGVDAGNDAGVDAGNDAGVDAGNDAGVDAGQDAGPDAGVVDAGEPLDGGWTVDSPINTVTSYWHLTFQDDFKGKTGSPDDAWCFDQLPAKCTIWGGDQHDCDLTDTADPGMIPPIKANLAAALAFYRPNSNWNAASEAEVRAAYVELVAERTASLNKCNWTVYQMVNWMATDYAGNYSARFDPTRVTVDPHGKGYLELSATLAPVQYDCVYGGQLAGPNCNLYSFAAGVLSPTAGIGRYWADPDDRWPGVYYAPTNGQCPLGGTFTGVNCQVASFAPHFLDEHGPAFWVDPDARWPGIYYANQAYRCADNIDYSPSFGFRNLTCPILDGAIMSNPAAQPTLDPSGKQHPNGAAQFQGRFEVKARIPKGAGAFPAAWLLPTSGGWPYAGGEIDILEARDAANQAYQTYHDGKCYSPSSGQEMAATDPNDCANKGGHSVTLSLGYTVNQQATDEFSSRDHVYSAEWSDGKVDYFTNNLKSGTVKVGDKANMDPTTAPAGLTYYEATNFPSQPFYWILNHSTYVPNSKLSGWQPQTFLIDYVKTYARCTRNVDFCPCGGAFSEAAGCTMGHREPLHCPVNVANPVLVNGIYPPACAVANEDCPNGGTKSAGRCQVYNFPPNELRGGATYYLDVPSATVWYAPITGQCTIGGTMTSGHCVIETLPGDLLESGITYALDMTANGIYYTPDFRQ
jgi:hypothetical protein